MVRNFGLFYAVLATLLSTLSAAAVAEKSSAAPEKVKLKVAYFGHAGSEREKAFVGFLRKHFTEVSQADLSVFSGKRVPDANVVIIDYDSDYFSKSENKPPRVRFQPGYDQPTVTMGVLGALISDGLKTGYL